MKNTQFALLPGDRRQAMLCLLLERSGNTVQLLPQTSQWSRENLPPPGTIIPVPHADAELREQCDNLGFQLLEYGNRTDYKTENGAITAENALHVAMEEGRLLRGSRAVVLGWGYIGKPLCSMLCGVGAQVSVSARKTTHLDEIAVAGFQGVHTDTPDKALAQADFVFNTVPATVLTSRLLAILPKHTVVIDLASAPGGVDLETAKGFGLRIVPARGLPGKMTPYPAAEAVFHAICAALKENG